MRERALRVKERGGRAVRGEVCSLGTAYRASLCEIALCEARINSELWRSVEHA